MSSRVAYLLVIVCIAQAIRADPKRYEYERCMKDTKGTIESYEDQLKEFYEVQDKIWKNNKETLKNLQRSAYKSMCINMVELLRNITANLNEDVCEVLISGDIFEGPWKSKQDVPIWEICDFIAANGHIVAAILDHNKNVSPNCRSATSGVTLKDTCSISGVELNRADEEIIILGPIFIDERYIIEIK